MSNPQKKPIDLRYARSEDWQTFIEGHGTLGDALDMDKKELESIYALAYQKYNSGNFSEAMPLFQLLCQCNHFEAKYFLGLGAVRQALEEYTLAGETYSFSALVHPDDPRFPFYAAECHLALGDWKSAGSGFEMAILLSKDDEKYKALYEQAVSHFNVLKAKLERQDTTEESS